MGKYMDPKDPTGGVFGALTDWVPFDLGISEALGGATGSLERKPSPLNPNYPSDRSYSPEAYSTPSTSSSVSGFQVAPSRPTQPSPATSTNNKLPGAGGYDAGALAGSIGLSKDEARSKYPGLTMPEIVARYRQEAGERANRQRKQAQQIGKAWDPVIAELDAQLAGLPLRKAGLEGEVEGMATSAGEDIREGGRLSEQALEGTKRSGLRELEEDIRNQMTAAGRLIGGIGGGSSSAVQQASEAVTRSGQKTRGRLIEVISAEVGKINQLVQKEMAQLSSWKREKLMGLSEFFQEKFDQLSQAKAGATGDRIKSIEQLQFNVEQQLGEELSKIDSQVLSYAQQIDAWQRQREASLEDFARKQASLTADASDQTRETIEYFNMLTEAGLSDDDARQYMEGQGMALPMGVSSDEEEDAIDWQLKQDSKKNYFMFDPATGNIQEPNVPESMQKDGLLERLSGIFN